MKVSERLEQIPPYLFAEIDRKIAEAKKYLYLGISVKEACFLSGFSDYSNFIRTFKNVEGCSPGKFDSLSKPL